jgi:hypothetical protein
MLGLRRTLGRTSAVVAAAAVLALALPLSASAEPVGGAVNVSGFANSNFSSCGSSSIATNADSGVTVAAWAGEIDSASAFGFAPVHVSLIGANGAEGATATYQPTDAFALGDGGWCDPLSIDAGANGGFIVTWNHADDDNAIFGLLVSSTGAFIGSPFVVSSNTNYSDIETVSAAWSAAQSRYLVTWKANVSTAFPAALNGQQMVGRFVDATGAGIGSDFLVTDLAAGINNSQDVAYGAGVWVVVGVTSSGNTLQAVTVSSAGVVGPATPVPAPAGTATGPSVEYNAALNQFLIVSKTNAMQWGQLLDSTGALSGAPFTITTATNVGKPRAASLGVDGWLVTWHTTDSADIAAIEINSAAAVVGTPEVLSTGLNDTNVEYNFRPEAAFSPATGQAYVIWSRYDVDADASNVLVRAWSVTAAAVVPAAPGLAATGLDPVSTGLLGAVAALSLLGGLALVLTRGRARSAR